MPREKDLYTRPPQPMLSCTNPSAWHCTCQESPNDEGAFCRLRWLGLVPAFQSVLRLANCRPYLGAGWCATGSRFRPPAVGLASDAAGLTSDAVCLDELVAQVGLLGASGSSQLAARGDSRPS